jgi:hypothetical protein
MERHEFAFEPPDKIWSTNEDRNLNPYARAERILSWKTTAQLVWASRCNRLGTGRGLGPSLIRVGLPFRTRRIRDPHNYCGTVVKAVVDGLVLAGAWPDDTPEYVEHISPELHVGGEQIVVVSIFPRRRLVLECPHGHLVRCGNDKCDGGTEINL